MLISPAGEDLFARRMPREVIRMRVVACLMKLARE
jgi:hypothetical protein